VLYWAHVQVFDALSLRFETVRPGRLETTRAE
jgi:hypothetical protein